MEKLNEDFSFDKYGLRVQLVNENDAEFILSLRANPNRTKHMVTLDNNIENQIKWIQEYKKNERKGLDYYFIYRNFEDRSIGVNRISHLDYNSKSAKSSSWISVDGLKFEPLKMLLLGNEIVFNQIGINITYGEVHKMNARAIKIFKLFGYKIKDTPTEFYNFSLAKDDFLKACENNILNRLIATNK